MPEGGEIRIETARSTDDQGRPCASIVFTDTGPGIPDEHLGNIFMPFYSTHKGRADHVGLGLSICYGIIKRHEGSMSVRNLERRGCQFTITLPSASRAEDR
jgi:signal transduction histidine kinase